MIFIKRLLIFFVLPFLAFTTMHKYYVSVTQIDYIQSKQAVQITTRVFIDDLEKLLRERYDETITLASVNEPSTINLYIERYLREKIKIKINNREVKLSFLGKEYDTDLVKCYLEIENVKNIESIEISNLVLFDLFTDQQNIIKTKINSKQKSFILIPQNSSTLLKFN